MANFSLEFFRLPERTDAVKTDWLLAGDLGKQCLRKSRTGWVPQAWVFREQESAKILDSKRPLMLRANISRKGPKDHAQRTVSWDREVKASSGMSPQLSRTMRKPQFYMLLHVHSSVSQSWLPSPAAIPPLDVSSLTAGNNPCAGSVFWRFHWGYWGNTALLQESRKKPWRMPVNHSLLWRTSQPHLDHF